MSPGSPASTNTRPVPLADPHRDPPTPPPDAPRASSTPADGTTPPTTTNRQTRDRGLSRWFGWGALSGFLAGAASMALHTWFAISSGQDALAPYRTVATLVEGPPAVLATAGIGMVVHVVLSVLFGLLLAAALAPLRHRSAGWIAWAGLLFGGALYLVDFQFFARNVGYFSAFREPADQPVELATHLVFGAVLAALLLLAKPRAEARPPR